MISRDRILEEVENIFYLCAFDDDTPPEDLVANLERARHRAGFILSRAGYGGFGFRDFPTADMDGQP